MNNRAMNVPLYLLYVQRKRVIDTRGKIVNIQWSFVQRLETVQYINDKKLMRSTAGAVVVSRISQ